MPCSPLASSGRSRGTHGLWPSPWQSLNFFPLPHGQGSLRPTWLKSGPAERSSRAGSSSGSGPSKGVSPEFSSSRYTRPPPAHFTSASGASSRTREKASSAAATNSTSGTVSGSISVLSRRPRKRLGTTATPVRRFIAEARSRGSDSNQTPITPSPSSSPSARPVRSPSTSGEAK